MSHLSFETVARLVDEAPTALEAAHLATCEACRAELQEMHEQVAQLSALPAIEPPADDWDRIERRLAAEGLIRARAPRRAWLQYGMRAAAALALLAVGTLAGRSMNGDTAPLGQVASAPGRPDGAGERPATLAEAPTVAAATSPAPARLASSETPRTPRDADEALQLLRTAEMNYLDALTRFAELSGSTSTGDPAARLAALEGIVLTTRAALGQAPTDPVINGYHLTALAQRDATLKQIAANTTDSWF